MSRRVTITISIDLPDGAEIRVEQTSTQAPQETPVEEYFCNYLSDNGRQVFGAAAAMSRRGVEKYTFEQIAEVLERPVGTILSWHRSTGRTAKRWEREKGQAAPILLDWKGFIESPTGNRNVYSLPSDVAAHVPELGDA